VNGANAISFRASRSLTCANTMFDGGNKALFPKGKAPLRSADVNGYDHNFVLNQRRGDA